MWEQVKSIVGQAAPLVGSLLGGPSGNAVGSLLAGVLGVKDSPEEIIKELLHNPEALLKIVEFQAQHSNKLQALALDQYTKQLEDSQDARDHNSEHWMPPLLTLILCAMVAGMYYSLFKWVVPEKYEQLIFLITGQVMGAFSTAIVFWLGATMMQGIKRTRLNKGIK
ncbi:hypothetical protein [Vibrio splendidus]|uniref:hypothetical protein n=1 Tax=Vibrio splendidus TaxID=29497 RepID=UPI000769D55D|nr:hypothetical protein [Vibrio splendidus]PHX05493.1 hypothetical protein VSPL_28870 [Vibrio splendidus]